MERCHRHRDTEARGLCAECVRPICDACQMLSGVETVCPECLLVRRKRAKVRTALAAVAAVGLLGGAGFALTQIEGPFDYGRHAADVRKLSDIIEREPCDRRAAIQLGEAKNRAGDYRGAINTAHAFWEQCGALPRMRWVTYHAHKQLSEFDQAVREATVLVDEVPEDQDYYWWRGQAYTLMGDHEKAAADYEQCLLLLPTATSCPFDLSKAYEKLGRPCDGLFPIEHLIHMHPEYAGRPKIVARLNRLESAGKCGERTSGAKTVVKFVPGRTIPVTAKINGHKGRFLVDTGASLVSVTPGFAAQAGLSTDGGRRILLKTANGVTSGQTTHADEIQLVGAKAARVEVVVVKNLDDSIDGLLGLSFLSRFKMELDEPGGKLVLTPR